jgi:hypothetical protein
MKAVLILFIAGVFLLAFATSQDFVFKDMGFMRLTGLLGSPTQHLRAILL